MGFYHWLQFSVSSGINDWVKKLNKWGLGKELNFDHTGQLYMQRPETFVKNEMQKVYRDFEIKKNNSIWTRWPDRVIINKKKKNLLFQQNTEWSYRKIKKKTEWIPKNLKSTEYKGNSDNRVLGTIPTNLKKRLERLEIWETIETIQNTVLLRSARILRRVLKSWRDFLSFKFQWKPPVTISMESQKL